MQEGGIPRIYTPGTMVAILLRGIQARYTTLGTPLDPPVCAALLLRDPGVLAYRASSGTHRTNSY